MLDADPVTRDPLTGLALPTGVTLAHLSKTIGTEVGGIDLREPLTDAQVGFLRALWLERKVIFFRDQPLTEDQHIRLGRCFGRLEQLPPQAGSKDGYPELMVFRRGADAGKRENFWHQDIPFRAPPVDGTLVLLRTCPPMGGDTLFVDMCAAYDGLSDWLKRGIEGLRAEHRFDTSAAFNYADFDRKFIELAMDKFPPMVHPVVQVHPETGRKVLYVSIGYTSAILGIPRDESMALIKLLSDQARIPEYQCRFKWEQNSIAFWDNRAVQHYATFDYEPEPRELDRVTILGELEWGAVPSAT